MKNVLKGIKSCFSSIKSDWSTVKKETKDIISDFHVDYLPFIGGAMPIMFICSYLAFAILNWSFWVVVISICFPFLTAGIASIFIKLFYYFKMKMNVNNSDNISNNEVIEKQNNLVDGKSKEHMLVLEKFNVLVNKVSQVRDFKIKKLLMSRLTDILNEYKSRISDIENSRQQHVSLNIDNKIVLEASILRKLEEFEDSMRDILEKASFNDEIRKIEEKISDSVDINTMFSSIQNNNYNDDKELKHYLIKRI